jgi:tetratricopeptide (TPR) repeat protein
VRRRLFLLLLAAFALKAAALAHFNGHPLLQPAGDMDSGVYARLAADVARGDALLRGPGPVPYFVSPLYIYFLAAVHALSAGSLLAAKAVQIALGTAAVGLVWGMTRRLFDDRAALVAGILYALTGVVTFHEILILQAALDPFLTALSLFLLAYALTPGRISLKVNKEGGASAAASPRWAGWEGTGWGRWLAAGGAFGLLALNRPNAILCVAAIAVVLIALTAAPLVARRRGDGRLFLPFKENPLRTFRCAAAFLAGTAALVALPFARNLIVSGEPVLISSHGGLNLYVGNNEKADGTYHHVEGITPSIEGQARDSRAVAEAALGRKLTTSEVSRYFAAKAFAWMREHPRDAARLFLRKLAFTLNRKEITLDYSYAYYSNEEASALRLLFVGAGILVPLGLVGLAARVAARPRARFLVWAAFVPAYVISVAAFFVSSRYRLPLLLPLAAGAGFLLDRVGVWLARRTWKPLVAAGAALLPLFVLANWDFHLDDGVAREETDMVLHLIERDRFDEARAEIERVEQGHRQPSVLHFRAALAYQAKDHVREAVAEFERALTLDPGRREIEIPLGAAHERIGMAHALAGRAADAMRELEVAVRLDPTGASARQNLAALYAEAGRFEEARALAREALRLNPGYPQAEALLQALDGRK